MTINLQERLAPNFILAELVASSKAQTLGIDNTPPPAVLPRLRETAEMLQRVRDFLSKLLGRPVGIIVPSAYRCAQLNTAVGGVTSSDHLTGEAADVIAPAFGTPSQLAAALAPELQRLGVGQIILEGVAGKQWVHLSTRIPDKLGNRVLTITDAGARQGIVALA
jgi:hypothetical protein